MARELLGLPGRLHTSYCKFPDSAASVINWNGKTVTCTYDHNPLFFTVCILSSVRPFAGNAPLQNNCPALQSTSMTHELPGQPDYSLQPRTSSYSHLLWRTVSSHFASWHQFQCYLPHRTVAVQLPIADQW